MANEKKIEANEMKMVANEMKIMTNEMKMVGNEKDELLLAIGDRVCSKEDTDKKGTVMFIGPLESLSGIWVGVDWDDPCGGKHDGMVGGRRYFQARYTISTGEGRARDAQPWTGSGFVRIFRGRQVFAWLLSPPDFCRVRGDAQPWTGSGSVRIFRGRPVLI